MSVSESTGRKKGYDEKAGKLREKKAEYPARLVGLEGQALDLPK